MRTLPAVSLSLLLAACASRPVPEPGPMLPKGPLHGTLDHGVYHDVRDWFTISTPIPAGDPSYGSLEVSEQYRPNVNYVAFVPHTTPGEYYRVFVEDMLAENRPVQSLDAITDAIARYFQDQVVRQRLEPLHLVEEKPWDSGHTRGILRLYTERVPSELVMQNLGMAEDYTAYMLVYATIVDGKVAFMWMEWPEGCTVCQPPPPGPATGSQDPIDQALATNGRVTPFMASFRFGSD